jgi:hypothetical protein
MLNFLREMKVKGYTKVTDEFKMDVRWWLKYVEHYNGVSFMLEPDWYSPDEIIETDACLSGCGSICGSEYFHTEFPSNVLEQEFQINILEMLCVLVAIQLWSDKLHCKRILIKCDNMVSVDALNNLKTRNRMLQACVRHILYVCGQNNFLVKMVHVPGCDNRVSDALSRWHLDQVYIDQFHTLTQGRFIQQKTVDKSMFTVSDNWL